MKQHLLKTWLLLCALIVGGGSSVWATDVTYKLTIDANDFNTTSYAANNNEKTSNAVCTTDNTKTYEVKWTSNQVMKNGSNMQWQKTKGYIYNSTDLGTISSVSVTSSGGTFTTYYGTSAQPSSGTSGSGKGYFKTSVGDATGTSSKIEVTFTISEGSGSSAVATTTTIDASGITNTDVYVGTAAGSLSASVTYGNPAAAVPTASVTWDGDNDDVATIDASTGVITLVGAGTVTFTATYAGVENEYLSSSDTYEMTVTNDDPDIVTIWSENFSSYSANGVPSGGTYSYSCVNGNSDTKIYDATLAGGTKPELLVGNSGGSFTAIIPLLTSTYGYSGSLTLTFKTNNTNIAVSTTTEGVTVTGSIVSGANTITLSGITTSMENVVIRFSNYSQSSNVRLDDIVLKGKQSALTVVATPSISPASGAVASGTEVDITCGTDGATIYYTTDGSTPTSSSTQYDPENKPTITSACTIKAIGVKDGLTDSDVASANYTIAEPCATPTFNPAGGEVAKGTTVTISCATSDATIYYTTNGDEPTTSSSVYSSALTINANQTIKAIAAKEGNANSAVASATYTLRDYATLPFSYDGNGLGELPTGLSQDGLTGKYDNSPKMKFDTTGDYLILKIGETPGTLSFDIKGNSFSDGTFTVQTSVDGSSYTDIETYTDLGDKQTETFTLAASVRYIKWIYTEKSSGNVALGNIKLGKGVSGTITPAGWASFSSSAALDLSTITGGTAYYASKAQGSTVTLKETTATVSAGTGLMIKGEPDATFSISVAESGTAIDGNLLKASDGTEVAASTTGTNHYVFGYNKENSSIYGFYNLAAATVVPAGKAYLETSVILTPAVNGAPIAFSFDDEGEGTTGIESIHNAQGTMHNEVFDLQGRRVAQPTKGLYIVNGRKVVIK